MVVIGKADNKQHDYWSERIKYKKEWMKLEERKVIALEKITDSLKNIDVSLDTIDASLRSVIHKDKFGLYYIRSGV